MLSFLKRQLFIVCLLLLATTASFASHIKGGLIEYEYKGVGTTAGTSSYKITSYIYIICGSGATGPRPTQLGIYDAVTNAQVLLLSTTYSGPSIVSKTTFNPCLSPTPSVCYAVYTYTTTVELKDNANGYIIGVQDARRIAGIVNIVNSNTTGISITATIPGILNGVDYHINSSPVFEFKDTAVICYNAAFAYQFEAIDADKDSLSYAFNNSLNGASNLTSPPYSALTYNTGYSGTSPLGSDVTIDPVTGLISGKAPPTTGEYVIAVYVKEWRNGVPINETKKELQISVGNCSLSAAALKIAYINCDDFVFTFQNETAAANITSYLWDFGVTTSTKDTSTKATPTYTYADTGVYILKLFVANSGGCQDSANSTVKVFPGFKPAFIVSGSCYQSPFQFTDASTTSYGFINSWLWDFGDPSTTTDTSTQKNINYQYIAPGTNTATLMVTNSKGCTGTALQTIIANAKPQIILPFTDTLICSIDSVPLIAKSNGSYNWTPNYNIINPYSSNPIVYPKDTTVYTITVTDKGCVDSATITVNVLDFISVKLSLDTGICRTDTAVLSPVSDALSYVWKESGAGNTLSSYNVKYPKASPTSDSVIYYVTANLGYCQDKSQITVHTSPYPTAIVSADTTICFGNRATLTGTITGTYFSWNPTNNLINGNTLQPTAGPQKTTTYVLSVSDKYYCPKAVTDTVVVTVVPLFNINAGHDTSVVLGQPLQLAVTTDTTVLQYVWQPATYLNNNTIFNPIATINNLASDYVKFTVKATTKEGCFVTDDVLVKVYKIAPDILIPTGFTPNSDGKNDVLKPILIGISKLDFFNVYNRFGQLLFTTSQNNKGWDGTNNGAQQGNGTYVFMAQGIDYLGKVIFKKGTVVLVR